MTRVRCWQDDCRFWKEGICSSPEIEYYPDEGCTTMEEGGPEEEEEEESEDEDLYEDEE